MANNPFTSPSSATPSAGPAPRLDHAALARENPAILSDANWLWWIAALSLINTVLTHTGSETSFAVGLGFTLIADAIFRELPVVALAIDLVSIGTITALGWFARRGQLWAFITGAVLYALDTLIFIPLQAWIAVAFHVVATAFLVRGAIILRRAIRHARTLPPAVAPA